MKLHTIVVGEDFSEPSLSATRWSSAHLAPDADIVLVHSVEVPTQPAFMQHLMPAAPELIENARRGAEARLRNLAAELDGDRVRFALREGRPADRIAEVAREVHADLIVVGEHGHHRRFGNVLGSTAERLARSAPAPVLLARGLPPGPPRRILLPIKESDLLPTALAWGRSLADRFDAEVVAFYAVPPMIYGRIRAISMGEVERHLERDLMEGGREWIADRLREAGFSDGAAKKYVTIGDPSHEIIAAVERFGIDLIVMPARSRGAVEEALLGSVARTVLRGANCPVLVVNRNS